jgi:transposase-like protein
MNVRADDFSDPYAPLPPLPSAPATSLATLRPPEPALLGPLAPGAITLIRGPRGVGKSWLALAMAHAIASDGALLGWTAQAAPVLYVEAAMSGALLGARLRALGPAAKLRIVCDERLDLTETDDQARLMEALPEGGVLVLDGLSLLVRRGGEGWTGFVDWLRRLRRSGHAIVLVAPTARPALAALADTLVTLRRAEGDGVAFAVEITSRQKLAATDRAFTVELDLADGKAQWNRAATVPAELRDVVEAARAGATVRDIAARLGIPNTTAWRRLEKARTLGLIEKSGTGGTARASAPAPAAQPHGTSGTDLAAVSTAVLKRTLARRKEVPAGQGPRPGPAILAGVADAALAAECARRLKPPQAERLLAQYAMAAG